MKKSGDIQSQIIAFRELLASAAPQLSATIADRVTRFYEIVLRENELQNLTRLTSPEDFFFGHLQDVLELLKTGWVQYPALDLGSGVGVPGLLAALIEDGEWILAESEKRKADYLSRAVATLEMNSRIRIVADRAEEFLKKNSVNSVVVRAVASLEKIYRWLRTCSTWNRLLIMKGPSWRDEWSDFRKSRLGTELVIHSEREYTLGPEEKQRVIILVSRNATDRVTDI